jgi:hypothetical protein
MAKTFVHLYTCRNDGRFQFSALTGRKYFLKLNQFQPTGALRGLKGKPVQVRHGPAAVTGDETCETPLFRLKPDGKAQGVGGSGNQKTCL